MASEQDRSRARNRGCGGARPCAPTPPARKEGTAVTAEPDREDAAVVERQRRLVMSLYQTIKVSQFHQFGNAAMSEPIAHFTTALEEFLRLEGSATVSENEGHIFVNGRRFAVSGAGFQTVAELLALLERKRLGGVRFERRLDKAAIQVFLQAFGAIPPDTADGPSFLRAWLADHGAA